MKPGEKFRVGDWWFYSDDKYGQITRAVCAIRGRWVILKDGTVASYDKRCIFIRKLQPKAKR
jgi:hypothetical protein